MLRIIEVHVQSVLCRVRNTVNVVYLHMVDISASRAFISNKFEAVISGVVYPIVFTMTHINCVHWHVVRNVTLKFCGICLYE